MESLRKERLGKWFGPTGITQKVNWTNWNQTEKIIIGMAYVFE
jgi:hypothetical protein